MPYDTRGSGIRSIHKQNQAFLMKLGFVMVAKWVQVLTHKYKWSALSRNYKLTGPTTHLWRNVSHLWTDLRVGIKWSIGSGRNVRFWEDYWLGDSGLLKILAFAPIDE